MKPQHHGLHKLVIPKNARRAEWLRLSGADELIIKNPKAFENLASSKTVDERVISKIEKDLARTCPSHTSPISFQNSLRRVLHAYAAFCPTIGYVQGMNFLVATLLHELSEDQAFWVFVQLMKKYKFEKVYSPGLAAVGPICSALTRAMQLVIPEVLELLENVSISPNVYALNWVLTLFAYRMEHEFAAAVLDVFLVREWDFIIAFCVSLLYLGKEELLQKNIDDLVVCIQSLPSNFPLKTIFDTASYILDKLAPEPAMQFFTIDCC